MLRRMGEQVQPEDDVVAEWEAGLPTADNLTPLSKSLIPPELASAFKITPETPRTAMDVHRASQSTLSSLGSYPFVTNPDDLDGPDPVSDSKKTRRTDEDKSPTADEDQSTANKTALKRPRLVWTAELHNRFVQVVARLGLNNAVPKTIMQLMNVDGLTRENVASHLQKYRLYIKRQGLLNDGLLPSDHHQLFAQQSFAESSNANGIENHNSSRTGTSETNHLNHVHSYGQMMMPIAMPYNHHHHPQMMQMPMTSSSGHGFHSYHNQQHHKYNRMVQQQSDWSGNDNKRFNGY